MDNKLKIAIIIGILSISLSVAYHYVVYIPDRDAKQLLIEQREKANKELDLQLCLDNANSQYLLDWNNYCKLENKPDDCNLLANHAESVEESRSEMKDNCFKQYK